MATCPKVSLNFMRQLHNWQKCRSLKSWKKDGVKYGLLTHYPRSQNQEVPQITPTKLLMVHRVKSYKGNPHWEKATLRHLGFEETGNNTVIVKNTPEMCSMLWTIKHLIKITPIRLPDKLPNPDDLGGCHLHENGTFSVVPKVDPVRVTLTEAFQTDPKRFDNETITEKLRLQWLSYGVH